MLVDLSTGGLVPGFSLAPAQWPRLDAGVAVMAASRQVLLIDPESSPNPANHGIWYLPFEGGGRDLAAELGLPDKWAVIGGIIPYGEKSRQPAVAADRVAMDTRPAQFFRAPGPRHLLVYFNSAIPIRAFVSKGMEDAPANITWSRKGDYLAFTSGNTVYVWQPTREPGEPELNAAPAQVTGIFTPATR